MDDLKREIWMQVRAEIQATQGSYICNQLEKWMRSNGLLPRYRITDGKQQAILEEFFPEFGKLADGVIWYRSGSHSVPAFPDSCPPWFEREWKEPRLALIDYILTSTT